MILKFDFQRDEVSFFFLLSHPTALPCITGVDDLRYVLPRHEALHIVQGRLLAGDGGVAEGLRQDGQILIPPFFEAFIIAARVQRGYQVPHTPGYEKAGLACRLGRCFWMPLASRGRHWRPAPLIKTIGPG